MPFDPLLRQAGFSCGKRQDLFFDFRVQAVDFLLNVDGQSQGRDHTAVGADLIQVETPFAPVLEPLLADLVPADAIGPYVLGHGREILRRIDMYPLHECRMGERFFCTGGLYNDVCRQLPMLIGFASK